MDKNENAAEVCQPQAAQMQKHCAAILGAQPAEVKPRFRYPSPETVHGRVLGALLRGEHLTHKDCWLRFGSSRLSHHIYVLRGTGWVIQMVEQTVTTSDAGRSATIGVYSLAQDVVTAAGEQGQHYAEDCARVEVERRAA